MGAESSRPWLVIVTGEPGSGKTRLGTELASALRVPFLSRDHVRGGLLATEGLWTNQLHHPPPREAAVEALVDIVETTARRGVTSVLEFVVTPPRRDALHRLRSAAHCLVIRASCRDAAARAERRDRADPLLSRPDVLAALGYRSIDQYLSAPQREIVRATMQSEFDLPLLNVATDDGYDPQVDQVVDWIIEQTRR